jgi:hypothetical protein
VVASCQFRYFASESAGAASGDLILEHAGETHFEMSWIVGLGCWLGLGRWVWLGELWMDLEGW